jgi:hypothetical protein
MPKSRQKCLPLTGGRYRYDPKISGKERLSRLIGSFGVTLAHKFLRGEVMHSHDSRGDIVNHRDKFYAEVKMAGKDRVGFPEHQLEAHLEGEDDYARLCVAVKYKSWEYDPKSRKIVRMVARTKTEGELNRFLAKNTSAVYVLDASIVFAIGKKPGCKWLLLRGDGSEKKPHIRLPWSILTALEENPEAALEDLGLDPSDYTATLTDEAVRVGRFRVRVRRFTLLREEAASMPLAPTVSANDVADFVPF